MIVGLVGKLGSGKDTITEIIKFLVYKGIVSKEETTYEDWVKVKSISVLDALQTSAYKAYCSTFAFGNNVKRTVAIMYGIPLNYLHDRDYKDNYYYCISENNFIRKEDIAGHKFIHINPHNVKCVLDSNVYFSLRELLQLIGTDIGKNILGSNIWINSTLDNVKYSGGAVNIITDVRFQDELDAIINYDIHHLIIKVVNTTEFENNKSNHSSEDVDSLDREKINRTVKWDGTVNAALFAVIKDIYYKHIKTFI